MSPEQVTLLVNPQSGGGQPCRGDFQLGLLGHELLGFELTQIGPIFGTVRSAWRSLDLQKEQGCL